jgi:hypothetical protein
VTSLGRQHRIIGRREPGILMFGNASSKSLASHSIFRCVTADLGYAIRSPTF